MKKEKEIHFPFPSLPQFGLLAQLPPAGPLAPFPFSPSSFLLGPAQLGWNRRRRTPSSFSLPLTAWARMSVPSPTSHIARGQAATVARAHFASWERLPRASASTKGGLDPSPPSLLPPPLHFHTRRAHESRNHHCSRDPPKLGEPPRGLSSLGSLCQRFSSVVSPPGSPPSPHAFSFATLGL